MTEIDLFIQREGHAEAIHHKGQDGITIEALKIHIGGEDNVVGIFIFEEDADEPLEDSHQIRHHGDGTKFLHHSRHRKVHVDVRYNGKDEHRDFGPGFTIARVKRWAERKLGIDEGDGTEMSLQIAGTTRKPDDATHIGTLIKDGVCNLVFDLVPGKRVNGAK